MDEIRRLLEALRHEKGSDAALERLATLGLPLVPWPCVRPHDPDHEVRCAAAEALLRIEPPAVEALCELLYSRHLAARGVAAEALGQIGDRRAVIPLCETLPTSPDSLALIVAEALGSLGDPRASGALCQALSRLDPEVRAAAARALRDIGPDTADALLGILSPDPNHAWPETAWRDAAGVLVHFGEPRSIEPLRQALADPRASIRSLAADGLSRLGARAAIPDLCGLLDHPDADIRKVGALALGRFTVSCPAPELRQALKTLEHLAAGERHLPAADRVFSPVATAIRAATDEIARHPLPASPPNADSDRLPRPAAAAAPDGSRLPIAAAAPPAAEGDSVLPGSWWKDLLRPRT